VDLLEQEIVSGSGISRAICKSAPRPRQITTPVPHHSVLLWAGCPSCRPTNSVKALKVKLTRLQSRHVCTVTGESAAAAAAAAAGMQGSAGRWTA